MRRGFCVNRSAKKHGRSCAITARLFVPLVACLLTLLPCANASADAPVTLRFHADRQTAGVGETVHWTVWLEFPEHAVDRFEIVGVSATFRARNSFSAISDGLFALTLPERASPTVTGANVDGILIVPGQDTTGLPDRVPLYAFSTFIVNSEQPLWYDIDATVVLSNQHGLHYHHRANGRSTHGDPIRVRTGAVNMPRCSEADLAGPYGRVDPNDLTEFIALFETGSPLTDLVAPFGVTDFADLSRFMQLYFIGCHDSIQR
jgi:hypothetical protein